MEHLFSGEYDPESVCLGRTSGQIALWFSRAGLVLWRLAAAADRVARRAGICSRACAVRDEVGRSRC